MSLNNIFNIAGTGMHAQTVRLTTTASNISNAEVAASTPEDVYKARNPIFSTQLNKFTNEINGVNVQGISESKMDPIKQYQPGHPLANEEGYIFLPKVNVVEEMTNMISASRSYEMNVEMLSSTKKLMLQTLQLGE